MSYKITIDAGISGTGYAVWDGAWELIANGVINPTKRKYNVKQAMANRLDSVMKKYFIIQVYIEYPQKFSGVKGDMVANKGDLVKLAAFVGYLEGYFELRGAQVEMVRVVDWKGQLPKDTVIKRIKRILPGVEAKSHDYDAIGIGLYLRGDF